jgi:hypothetical protein
MKPFMIIFTLLISHVSLAKRLAGNKIRRYCSNELIKCERHWNSLAMLSIKHNDIHYNLTDCENPLSKDGTTVDETRWCFSGTLDLLYIARPSQSINMIVEPKICERIVKATQEVNDTYANCIVSCKNTFSPGKERSLLSSILIRIFKSARTAKPVSLVGTCRVLQSMYK